MIVAAVRLHAPFCAAFLLRRLFLQDNFPHVFLLLKIKKGTDFWSLSGPGGKTRQVNSLSPSACPEVLFNKRLSRFIILVKIKTKKSHIFFSASDNRNMIIEGDTITEMAEATQKTRHAIESWLFTHGVEPLFSGSIYPPGTIDKIREARRGRPRKQADTKSNPRKPRNNTPHSPQGGTQ
jgi:hypothetical protein